MNKETITLIEQRKSYRAFKKEEVSKDVLDQLKMLTLRAPSAGNMELYSIIEVTDNKIKEELAEICDNQKMIANAPIIWIFLADNNKWERYFTYSDSEEKFNKKRRDTGLGDMHLCMQDAIIASQNAVIAAEALGLGSCFIGDIIENYERLQKLLNLPSHAIPAAMLIMGYPLSDKKSDPITPRPDTASSIFMENGYKELTKEDIYSQYEKHQEYFENKKLMPIENGTVADYYYNRKYTSSFMNEMNRSAKTFIDRWINEQ